MAATSAIPLATDHRTLSDVTIAPTSMAATRPCPSAALTGHRTSAGRDHPPLLEAAPLAIARSPNSRRAARSSGETRPRSRPEQRRRGTAPGALLPPTAPMQLKSGEKIGLKAANLSLAPARRTVPDSAGETGRSSECAREGAAPRCSDARAAASRVPAMRRREAPLAVLRRRALQGRVQGQNGRRPPARRRRAGCPKTRRGPATRRPARARPSTRTAIRRDGRTQSAAATPSTAARGAPPTRAEPRPTRPPRPPPLLRAAPLDEDPLELGLGRYGFE